MTRREVVQIRVTSAEKAAIQALASRRRQDVASYLRAVALPRGVAGAMETAAEAAAPKTPRERLAMLIEEQLAAGTPPEEAENKARWELATHWPDLAQRLFFVDEAR